MKFKVGDKVQVRGHSRDDYPWHNGVVRAVRGVMVDVWVSSRAKIHPEKSETAHGKWLRDRFDPCIRHMPEAS